MMRSNKRFKGPDGKPMEQVNNVSQGKPSDSQFPQRSLFSASKLFALWNILPSESQIHYPDDVGMTDEAGAELVEATGDANDPKL